MVAASELTYQTNASAMQMAEAIFGDGVTVVSADYTGDSRSSAIYSNGDSIAPGATPGDTGVILSTGRAKEYTNSSGEANQDANQSRNTSGENNNADFNAAAGSNTYDASYLDVTFIPDSGVMTMQFIFSSEEYPEFENSVYQDFVGVWINGVQVDLVVGNGDADPGNVNSTNNENLFLDNSNDAYNTEMDGLTVTMTLTMNVIPGVENTIRIGIADVSDSSYDSNLLIAGDSVQVDFVAIEDSTNLYPSGSKTIDVLANDVDNSSGTLTITHVNGVAVSAGSTVTLNTGQTVLLNADGTLTLTGDGDTENFNFTYTASNGVNTDTGFVNVSSIPCFVAGTLIRTPYGELAVEDLQPGDLVVTRDDGAQPIRWIGARLVEAEGDFAPIHIRKGTFGSHRDLRVSPQHRVLVRDSLAELLFGEAEVLVAAKDLLNDRSVTRSPGGEVTYVHLMFDRHQVIFSEGLETESFLPGPQTTNLLEQPVVDEICALFPELDPATGEGYGDTARPTLKSYEARLLSATKVA
ncbi:Hint domain-containing protein [Parasedimentitalea psychrophila]|uniref:Hint domain-containing protein n=1 Tax=Parasedimentitalea psychrophila TaxID=2997337 RepID=A0A9Y2L0X0_9RHOB|nr:Hint domain-containing protein [Parasedimentitalea psychrophila]WIY26720.1 Hint domain-containing protein [Parasedimentitalea psychrophila]